MVQGTQVTDETIVEQMLREAKSAPEPGEAVDKVIHKGGDDVVGPIVIGRITSAGHVFIYDTRSGDRSKCNRNMLPSKLKQKREDGSLVFTLKKPSFEPKRGILKCMLHLKSPERESYDELGLPVCRKANLISPYEVERHMQKRHKTAWEAIKHENQEAEKAELKAERQEDRELQRQLLTKVAEPNGEETEERQKVLDRMAKARAARK